MDIQSEVFTVYPHTYFAQSSAMHQAAAHCVCAVRRLHLRPAFLLAALRNAGEIAGSLDTSNCMTLGMQDLCTRKTCT